MFDVISMLIGILLGSIGVFLFSPTLTAIAVVLITAPLIQTIVDNMLAKKWRQVTITCLLIAAYISVSIWALSLFADAATFQDRLRPGIIIIGAGIIQLAWVFLVAIRLDSNGSQ
jgi:hypothetical protein